MSDYFDDPPEDPPEDLLAEPQNGDVTDSATADQYVTLRTEHGYERYPVSPFDQPRLGERVERGQIIASTGRFDESSRLHESFVERYRPPEWPGLYRGIVQHEPPGFPYRNYLERMGDVRMSGEQQRQFMLDRAGTDCGEPMPQHVKEAIEKAIELVKELRFDRPHYPSTDTPAEPYVDKLGDPDRGGNRYDKGH